jgi:glycosyltransferase involved in cell wall biosynthesis
MTRSPRVSIGLPVYNGENYLESALNALIKQDFLDFELIISDNASTDATEAICRRFLALDHRVRYHRNAVNIGLAANHNRTFELSRGRYFKWAAHDDDFPSTMLSRFIDVMESSTPQTCVVYSKCEYIGATGDYEGLDSDHIVCSSKWPHVRLSQYIRNVHMYNCMYGLIKSDVLRRTRLFGCFPISDHVLFAELSMLGSFVEISEPLLRIRRHPGRTFTANKTVLELRRLFLPDYAPKPFEPSIWGRVNIELARSALVTPPSLQDKLLCFVTAVFKPQFEALRSFIGRQRRRAQTEPSGS